MTDERGYASPGAFRRALTDRLRTVAADSRWTLPQLRRHIAYDRLLERLYLVDDGWIIKGAAALLARDLGHARPSTSTSTELGRRRSPKPIFE